ncbi:MAG TPA: serine protease [Verrucomicrobia bacterium]|nr:MAG: hypothetical protein A2X46_04060 [Lentisphaerae bacterium GWF2_57_35]HBA84717.1 serine protease [Verrucomicrobiota bacterium]
MLGFRGFRRHQTGLWLFLCLSLTVPLELLARQDVKEAIVKIYTVHNSPDYYDPWSMHGPSASMGSGCIVKGNKILTNAHVVSDETFIQVRRFGESKRFQAHVASISHAADLALLIVDDPAFFDGVEPLAVAGLPHAQQEVLVYGFPMGGDTLSITKGVISRIENQTYAHSSASFLAVQIDAAVNPGNSGGPAIIDNQIVGVAMQGMSQADNIGYIVPAPIIRHFLDDIQDGAYHGFPSMGVLLQSMENSSLKEMYRMTNGMTGMLVTKILPDSPADGRLKQGDVLLSVDQIPVADDGTIEFRPKERTSVSYLVQKHQIGDPLDIEVWREGKKESLKLILNHPLEDDRLIPLEQYDTTPDYFIYGGVVFCPLTQNLLKAWGAKWYDAAPKDLLALLGNNVKTDDRDQVVLALKVLAADVNEGYHETANWAITEVNGKPIRNLKELVAQVEAGAGRFIVFADKQGNQLVLNREKVEAQKAAILKTYHIPQDRSANLMTAEKPSQVAEDALTHKSP